MHTGASLQIFPPFFNEKNLKQQNSEQLEQCEAFENVLEGKI